MSWTPPADPAGDPAASAALGDIARRVREAQAGAAPLAITGGGTKSFLLETPLGEPLDMRPYRGVLAYEPAELVIEVRAGTPLADIEAQLAAHGQMLASEPPRFGPTSTIGGVVSAGLSGPSRPWAGALRDHVLGIGLISPAGELLRFGGRVMKNVAGYDVSRLVTGAWGTLGPVATVALRVAPQPECTVCVQWEMDVRDAQTMLQRLGRTHWPLAGAAHDGELLRLRLSGPAAAVDDAVATLRPDRCETDDAWWQALRDLALPALRDRGTLWRISLPPATVVEPPAAELIDWGGAQRWWYGADATGALIRSRLRAAAGRQAHAVPMFAVPATEHAPLSGPQRELQSRIRQAFDPLELCNRGCRRTGH